MDTEQTARPRASTNPNNIVESLFAVRNFIEPIKSLELAQTFLVSANDLAVITAQQQPDSALWGITYLLQMVMAALDGAVQQLTDAPRD